MKRLNWENEIIEICCIVKLCNMNVVWVSGKKNQSKKKKKNSNIILQKIHEIMLRDERKQVSF